jgi:hypothetical protein
LGCDGWKPAGVRICDCGVDRGGERMPLLDTLEGAPRGGGGEVVAKRSDKFWFCVPSTGVGAANWVFVVVVEVDWGGAMLNAPADDAGGATGADWKSSKSSSSAGAGACSAARPDAADGAFIAAGAVVVGSSPKSKRSTSGSFGLAGAGAAFFASRRDEDGDGGAEAFLLPAPAPSSNSSYSSN